MSSPAVPYYLIVPAAGVGRRFGGGTPKQYALVANKPLVHHAIIAATAGPSCLGVVVALAADDTLWQAPQLALPLVEVKGGAERVDSVRNALNWIKETANDPDVLVLVHDAARPYLPLKDLTDLLQIASQADAGAILAAPVADTLKQVDGLAVTTTLDRASLWRALTPQAFPLSLLDKAFELALRKGVNVTDESSAVEALGLAPQIVQGSAANIKVTLPEDLLTVAAQMEAL